MRHKENEKYVKMGLTVITIVVVSLLCFFLFFRIQEFWSGIKAVINILMPFVIGGAIAYLLSPACNWMEKLLRRVCKKPSQKQEGLISALSIVITLLLALVVVFALIMMVLPQLCRSVIEVAQALPGELSKALKWVNAQLESQTEIQEMLSNVLTELYKKLQTWLQTDLLPTAQTVLADLGGRLIGVVVVLKNLVLGIIVSIYFLGSRKKFAHQGRLLLYGVFPRGWAKEIEQEVLYADQMFSGFLIGKLLDSAIVGVICFVCCTIMRFPSALLISVIIGVTNIIPFFGPFLGAIPCALLLLLEEPIYCLIFVIFIVILQQVDGNIIGPKILSSSTGLSGFWVLFAILLFGGLWGFIGMIVGVPLFAVIYDVVRKILIRGLKRHGVADMMEGKEPEREPVEVCGDEPPQD